MKKSLLILLFLLTSCWSSQESVRKSTEAAAQIDAMFVEHSNKWQIVFMAGKPSQETIAAVMAAAEEDRRKFHGLMTVFVQYLNSLGAIDPVAFQQQAIELAKSIKELGGGR
jgi:hypothetical protein